MPRDFLNILRLAAMRNFDHKISTKNVRLGIRKWYRNSKLNATESPRLKSLYDEIVSQVLVKNSEKCFLVEEQHAQELAALHDARLIHSVRKDVHSTQDPTILFRLYRLDSGVWMNQPVNQQPAVTTRYMRSRDYPVINPTHILQQVD